MNPYPGLSKLHNRRIAAAAVLALCVILSGAVLFSRLMQFSAQEYCHYIPLTRSQGFTTVTRGKLDEQGAFQRTAFRPGQPLMLVANPGFQVTDSDTVWQGQTDIEIFRLSYDNESGETTVRSRDGSKLLAPGTGNTYAFALKNTGNVPLQYAMDMEAYLSNAEYAIPVRVRVTSRDGGFLAGSEEEMADVMELNQVADAGTLRPGYVMPYTLEWEWPFEGDDAYDTLLGNLAVETDLTLTVVINTMASYTDGPGDGYPQTGDTSDLALMTTLTLLSAAGLLLMIPVPRRKREGSHE